MDDRTLAEVEGSREPEGPRRLTLGPAASLVLLGVFLGVAIGWLAWRGAKGPAAEASAGALPGMESGTLVEGVDVSNDPMRGVGGAPVTIVEFSDFECPFCGRFARQTAPALRRQYGDDIRWIFINTPLQSIHPRAYDLALAGECAHEQDRFWEWYDAMFSDRYGTSDGGIAIAAQAIGLDEKRFDSCYRNAAYAGEVAADLKESQKFYILGTPMFFINGRRLEGAQPVEAFASVVDSILSNSE